MKYLILAFLFLSGNTFAEVVKDDNCNSPHSSTGISMMDKMYNAMRIDTKTVVEEKTKTELISNIAVSERLARQYALESYNKNPDNWLSVKDYKEIYSNYNARNLIIKFTYENQNKKQNVFLVSALVNDYECGIRFNGYIIVKREF